MSEATLGTSHVKNIIAVLSGKGGVGKSTVTAMLAYAFRKQGLRVGVLDADLCGPTIPKLLGMKDKRVKEFNGKWVPAVCVSTALRAVSLGLMSGDDAAPVVWRGPRKTAVLRSLFDEVYWGDLDVLIVDTPPGTGDEHLTVGDELAKREGVDAVVVTTPQGVSVDDVRKELTFCTKVGLPVIGIVENMSGYTCLHCKAQTNIFSKGGGEILAQQTKLPFLFSIPIDPWLCLCEEEGLDPFETKESQLKGEMEDAMKRQYEKEGDVVPIDDEMTIGERTLKPLLEFAENYKKTKLRE